MKRKGITTGENHQTIDEVYELFSQGWILDPWLHGSNRPWSSLVAQHGGLGDTRATPSTLFVWNLILLEEDDDITDPEWVLKNCPVRNIPIPKATFKVHIDPIVDERIISYDEVADLVRLGYEMPEDKRWAKNRLAVLRVSGANDYASGMGKIYHVLLDGAPLNLLEDYIQIRKEREHAKANHSETEA